MKKNVFLIVLFLFNINNAYSSILKLHNWHDNKMERKKDVLINNLGEMGLKIINIPENVNKRATCGSCHKEEKIEKIESAEPHKKEKERTILVPTDKTLVTNLLARKNGGKLEFITSEYAKDFSNGPYQAAFINDGITDSRRNPLFGNQPSFWGCDMLTKWKDPFPHEFIYSFKENKKYVIDSFILYNAPGGEGDGFDAEVKNFSLFVNSDPITIREIYNVTDDGGGWCYNNGKFNYLSANNILGDGLFPSFQQPDKYEFESWIQSKNLEYTINTNNPKWVRIDFKKPTTISSIFITSDDSANVHNMETDIYKLKIIVITPTGEKVVYDNSKNQMVEDEFAKGYAAYFDPVEASGVIFKFYTNRYVEWQRITMFRKPWKKVLSARATQKFKDYSPEIFYFTPTEAQYLKISIESNFGNPKWVDVGEMEVYNSYPKNLASYENGGRILDCSRVDDYVYGPNRLLDSKLLGDDEYSIQKKDYINMDEYQIIRRRTENENDIKIILDLGKETVFGQINHYNTGDSGGKNLAIEYSLDNISWEELGVCEKLDYSERDLPNKDSFIFTPVRARFVKFIYSAESWIKNKLKISEYEIFEVTPHYIKEGEFITNIYDIKASSIFSKLVINSDGLGKVPLNTDIKITLTTDKVSPFTGDRHVSSYAINPNESSSFNISEIHNGDRFVQFKIMFTTKDISTTPLLNNISVEYQTLENIIFQAKEFENNKVFNEARNIYEKIKSGKYDPDWTLQADQGLVRIKDSINTDATALFGEGNKLLEREQFDASIEIFRDVLRKYPEAKMDDTVKDKIKYAEIGKEYQLAESLSQKRKYWKAVEQYKAIIDNYPNTDWAKKAKKSLDEYYEMETQDIYDNAKRLLNNKQFDESMVLFNQIKNQSAVWKWKQSAEEGIKECLKGKSEYSLKEAQKFFKNGDYEEALVVFKKVVIEYPETEASKISFEEIGKTLDKIMEKRFNMALKLQQNSKYIEAIKAFSDIAKESEFGKWKEKANAQIKENEAILHQILVDEAKKLYDEGLVLYKKEQIDKAYETFEKVAKGYKGTKWDIESQKFIDEISANRVFEEINKNNEAHNYYDLFVKFDELKKINGSDKLISKVNEKLNKEVEKIYEAGKRYDREKDYKKAYLVYNFIKVNFANTEWTDRIMDRLKRVEEKLKE